MDPGDVLSDLSSTDAIDYDGSCLLLAVQSSPFYDHQLEDEHWQQPERTQLNDVCTFSTNETSTPDRASQQQRQVYQLSDVSQQVLDNRGRVSTDHTSRVSLWPEPELPPGSGSVATASFYEQTTSDHCSLESQQFLHLSTQQRQLQHQLHHSYLDQLSVGYHGDGSLQCFGELATISESSLLLPPAVSSRRQPDSEDGDNGLTFINCRSRTAFPSGSTSGSLADEQLDCTTGYLYGRRPLPSGQTFAGLSSPPLLPTFDDCCVSMLTRTHHQQHANYVPVDRIPLTSSFKDCDNNPFLSTTTDVKPEISGFSVNSSSRHGRRVSSVHLEHNGSDMVVNDVSNRCLRWEAVLSPSRWTRFGESASSVGIDNVTRTSSSGLTSSVNCRSRSSSASFDQSSESVSDRPDIEIWTCCEEIIGSCKYKSNYRSFIKKSINTFSKPNNM